MDLRMVQFLQEILLVHDRVDRSLRDDSCLGHLLHRKQLFLLPKLDLPNLAEPTPSDDILEVEMSLVDRFHRK